jgi:hypothetical protein
MLWHADPLMSGSGAGRETGGGTRRRVVRRRTAWLLVVGLVLGWVVTISVLILTAPPAGAGSPAELAEQAGAALNSGDAEGFATLLAAPLDQEFAQAYVERLQNAGARNMTVTVGAGEVVMLRGQLATGSFEIGLVAQSRDGRWFLTTLPPV